MSKGKPNSGYVALLEPCKHTVRFSPPPSRGDAVYCVRCGAERTVSTSEPEWNIACAAKDCTLARNYGADETTARHVAHSHAVRFDHDVHVRKGHKIQQVVSPHGEQLTIPTREDHTPDIMRWLENNRDHSQSLRRWG